MRIGEGREGGRAKSKRRKTPIERDREGEIYRHYTATATKEERRQGKKKKPFTPASTQAPLNWIFSGKAGCSSSV